jgi:magnesium transporter
VLHGVRGTGPKYRDDRDVVTNTLEAYLSVQSNRMNETVKTLALMSTRMLPLSFIASFYGMNFRQMPELSSPYGYRVVIVARRCAPVGSADRPAH